ncbi:putative OmpA family protein [Gammaproteobacteria bacterium]
MPFFARVVTSHGLCLWMLTGVLLSTNPVSADEIQLYSAPPSDEDVRRALFPEIPKTRGIHLQSSSSAPKPETFNTATPAESTESTEPVESTVTPSRPSKPAVAPITHTSTSPRRNSTVIAVPVKFASNSAEIGADQMAHLDPIGRMMASDSSSKSRLIVEGHTDGVGSPAYNRNLSLRRAEAAKQYLVSHYEIDPNRLIAVGKGQSELLVKNDPRDERNRRIQFRRQ